MNAPYPMGSFGKALGVPATPSRSRPSGPAPTGLSGSAASITDAFDWRRDPRAASILASIEANPPKFVMDLAPLKMWLTGDEQAPRFTGRRADLLREIANEMFLAAERIGHARTAASFPSVDEEIAKRSARV